MVIKAIFNGVYLYVFIGSIPWFLVAELFGQASRPLATSIAASVNWLSNFIITVGFLPLSVSSGSFILKFFTIKVSLN